LLGLAAAHGVEIPREDIERARREARQDRVDRLKSDDDPGEADMSRYLTQDKAWIGNPQQRDGIEIGPKNITTHHSGSTDVGLDMNDVESIIKAGARRSMRIEAEINDLLFKDKTVNPRAKYVGTSVVNHYPLMMRRPPSITRGITRGIVTNMLAVMNALRESRTRSDSQIQGQINLMLEPPAEE
jgi:hypothetical protein